LTHGIAWTLQHFPVHAMKTNRKSRGISSNHH